MTETLRQTIQSRLEVRDPPQGAEDEEMGEQSVMRDVTCKVCLVKPGTILLLPCSHLASCYECSLALSGTCPICREIIETMTPVYFI
jgi:hypothetical protein